MSEIILTIDDKKLQVEKGATILEAARKAGIYIPTLCYHPDLKPYGGCRVCIVEIEGTRGLSASCTMPVTNGMVVHTETEAINKVRRNVLELLIADHPSDCLTCHQNTKCELQKIAAYLGITSLSIPKTGRSSVIDSSNPFFGLDRNRCILCARCTRTCNEITCIGAIDLAYRGFQTKVATLGDKPLMDSICKSCGECVAHCPTGALYPKETRQPTHEVLTTCPYCGVGCQMYLGVRAEEIVSIREKGDGSTNRGWLCVKGRYGISEFVHHPERLTTPMIKENGKLVESNWEKALDLVARKFSGYKNDEIAVISTAKGTNEDNYVIQKLCRVALRSNTIDHCARLCHAPTVAALLQSFGSGAMTNSTNEIRDAACIMAIGTNTTAAHPIIGFFVKQAVRLKGAKLIVANPREIALCRYADIWLRHNPGSDVALLMGLMRVIVDEGLLDTSFIDERCEGFDIFKKALGDFNLDLVERLTGVPAEKIAEAARMYATTKPATILYAMGVTQHSHGTDNVLAIADLAMLTGNIGKPSTGVNPLRGQNNVQGACDMGALPNVYPGYQSVTDPAVQEKFEKAWGCKLSEKPGLTSPDIIEAIDKGRIKALYLVGENPVLSESDASHVEKVLGKLEFLVVQDIFPSESSRLAHVILPAASFAEKNGTFTNTERRVQRVRSAIPPIGNSKPDWWITCQIGRRMTEHGLDFDTPAQIMEEIKRLTPIYGGIKYDRLENNGLIWPCPTEEHPGTPILHTQHFTRGKGKFVAPEFKPPKECPDEKYPLIMTSERSLFHYHTGTMTRKVKGLNAFLGEGMVEINPADATTLKITDGSVVKVISRRGKITAKAKITAVSPEGVVCMNFHFAESPTNVLTNSALDPMAKTPEFKVCAVRIEKTEELITPKRTRK